MLSGQLITPVIEFRAMEPGIIIKTERLKRNWSQAELGKRVGISQVAIRKIEKGPGPGGTDKSKHLAKIAQELEIPLSKLDASLSQYGNGTVNHPREQNSTERNQTLNIIPGSDLIGEVDLPVFSIRQDGLGALVLENEPFTHISRPRRLIGKKSGYGVLIFGNSMAPEYREGDTAYVDPHLHPKKDDPCIFERVREDGKIEVLIKYLERSPDASKTVYYVRQEKPFKKFTIKKASWQKVHVLVGKESGR